MAACHRDFYCILIQLVVINKYLLHIPTANLKSHYLVKTFIFIK